MPALHSHVLLVGLVLCVLAPASAAARDRDDSVWHLGQLYGRGECVVLSDGSLPARAVSRSKPSFRDELASTGPRAVWRTGAGVPTAAPLAPRLAEPDRDGRQTHLRIGVLLV